MKFGSAWIVLFCFLVFLLSWIVVLVAVIPHMNAQENVDSPKCSCDNESRKITCEGISHGTRLKISLRQTWKQNRFDEFILKSSNVTKLTDGIFGNLSFAALRFEKNNLNLVSRFALKGSEETVLNLWFDHNNFSPTFDLKFLLLLRQLKSLHITESNLKTIATGSFGTLPHLERINVESNNFNRLGKFAFSLLPNLLLINLSKNKLTKLEKNMFNTSHAQSPVKLNLSHNEIQEVEADAFADLKANYVNLEHNKLMTLNQDAFEPLLDSMFSLENSQLLVKGNPILCDSALKWLNKKPVDYRHLVKGLPCLEDPKTPQTIIIQKPLDNGTNCRYQTGSDHVQAFYQGTLLVNRSLIPHLEKIILRCSNVQNLKFVDNHVVQCVDGKFKEAMPDCLGLLPNNYSTVLPLLFTTSQSVSGAVRNCTYFPRSLQVEGFYHGKTLESGTPVLHSGKVTFRCNNVQNMKLIGNRVLHCNDGRFTAALPECKGLLPNDSNSAPPVWVRTDPHHTLKISEEGVVLIPRRSAIFVTCWWSQGKPDVTVSGDIQIRSQKPGTFNKVKGWVTEIAPVTEVLQINYTCSVPESKPGGILTQEMQLKVTDTCQLNDSKIEALGLIIDPQSKRVIYEEEDNVYLLCGERVTKGILYITCKSDGKWDWGPEFDCPK